MKPKKPKVRRVDEFEAYLVDRVKYWSVRKVTDVDGQYADIKYRAYLYALDEYKDFLRRKRK